MNFVKNRKSETNEGAKWRSVVLELDYFQCVFANTCLVWKPLLYSPKAPWEEAEWWAQKQEINIGKQPGKKENKALTTQALSNFFTIDMYF